MAVSSGQVVISSSTPTNVAVSGQINLGSLGDPIPCQVKNIDASITIYLGGPAVSTSTGYPLLAGASISFGFVAGDDNALYALAASGSPKLAFLTLRQ
jgi:hypothetical protein